ncbi:MAG: hypothetical protein ACRCXC_10415 [Legionella sp.]
MRLKLLIGFTVAMSFAGISHADFKFYSDPNACNNVAGSWVGSGKASNWWLDCSYEGAGTVSVPDVLGGFTLEVNANRSSGSFLCPEHATARLEGICLDGVVLIR